MSVGKISDCGQKKKSKIKFKFTGMIFGLFWQLGKNKVYQQHNTNMNFS